jgi:cytochrome P450
MGVMTLAGRLARFSPRLVRLAARLAGSPLRYMSGAPSEREMIVLNLPAAKLALLNDLDVVKQVLNDREGTFPKSSDLELLLQPLIGRGVFGQPGGDAVKQVRRVYVRALSQVPDGVIDRVARQLTRQYLADWKQRGRRVPIPSELSRLTIDIVSQATLETRFTPQQSQRFVDLFFEYHKRANPLVLLLAPRGLSKRRGLIKHIGLEEIGAQMRALIRERFVDPLLDEASRARLSPFASALLESADLPNIGGAPLARDEARKTALVDEISVMLLAGHETSASVLSWLLWELAGQPDEQDSVGELLRAQETDAGGGLASDSASHEGAQPRVSALIQESLRMYPPIAFLLRETQQDVVFRDRAIPTGSYVVVSPWTLQRHRRLWQNSDRFDPTRWLGVEPPADRMAFIPFGQGPRVCPGKRFAELEMVAIMSELLLDHRFARARGRRPQPLGSLTSRPDRDFRLVAREIRES